MLNSATYVLEDSSRTSEDSDAQFGDTRGWRFFMLFRLIWCRSCKKGSQCRYGECSRAVCRCTHLMAAKENRPGLRTSAHLHVRAAAVPKNVAQQRDVA